MAYTPSRVSSVRDGPEDVLGDSSAVGIIEGAGDLAQVRRHYIVTFKEGA